MKTILRYGDSSTWGSIPGVARAMGCSFLDTSQIVVSSDIDGVRFDLSVHRKLGQAGGRPDGDGAVDGPGRATGGDGDAQDPPGWE